MTSNRLKNLAKLRLILSVIALLLAIVMTASGVMHFIITPPRTPAEDPTAPAEESGSTIATAPSEVLEPFTPIVTVPEEPAEHSGEPMDDFPEEEQPPLEREESAHPSGRQPSYGPSKGTAIPPADNSSTVTPPADNSSTVTPPADNSGTVTPPADNSGTATPPADNSSTATPPADNSSTATPPADNSGTATPPAGNSGTATPPADNSGTATPPADNSGTATPPADNSSTVTPPADNSGTATPPADNGNTTVSSNNTTDANNAVPSYTVDVSADTSIVNRPEQDPEMQLPWEILFWSSAALLALDLAVILYVSYLISKEQQRLEAVRRHLAQTDAHARRAPSNGPASRIVKTAEPAPKLMPFPRIATIHQIGKREYQQDSSGHTAILNNKGIIAVLADGMGGLSGGDKISQKIVMDAMSMAHHLNPSQINGVLWKIVDKINENVNQMLGPEGLYKSGSTLAIVLAADGQFQWITVGDSRIYLYRQGYANQLNHDHDHLQIQMADVLSGRCTMEEALRNPDSRKLTSFIGMGQLKYVDGSRSAIALEAGDRLVLMSDGVYNIVSEDRLAEVLKNCPDVEQAASVIDRLIRESNHPHQDNYTAILLGF